MAFLPDRKISLSGTADEKLSIFSVLLRQYRENYFIYSFGILAVILTDITEVAIPLVIKRTIDFFSGTDIVSQGQGEAGSSLTPEAVKWTAYTQIFWILMGLFAIQFTGRVLWRLYLAQQTHFVAARLKSRIWSHARWLPRRKLETELSAGELMNIGAGDVGIARNIFGFTLVTSIDTLFLLIFCLVAMFNLNVELTLWSLALLPILPPLLKKVAKREASQHREAQECLSKLSDIAAQTVSTIRLQRVTDSQGLWQNRLKEAAEEYRQKRLKVLKTSFAFIPLTGIPPLIAYGILLGLGIQKVIAGQLSLGAFVALQSYIFMIQGPMFEMGVQISEWQRSLASLRRILKVLRESPEKSLLSPGQENLPERKTLHSQDNVFKVENLHFAFPDQKNKLILKGLSFSLKPGERLGIRGPVGVGKTTLLQILSGFERDFLGDVQLFGKDIRKFAHKDIREILNLVPQKPFLFATTVRENLKLDQNAPDDEIWTSLELAGLREDVEGFPKGLDTPLGEWGINLSGGQKQRLTLARALLRKPEILLLDDCLSAVDTVTEEKILHGLDSYFSQTTLVWVAHRASTLRFCDHQIVLEHTETQPKSSLETPRGLS